MADKSAWFENLQINTAIPAIIGIKYKKYKWTSLSFLNAL